MIEVKQCSKCGLEKPLKEFTKSKQNKTGYGSWCKQCNQDSSAKWSMTPSGIYSHLIALQKFYDRKPVTISREEFMDWYENASKKCHYCGIPENELGEINDSHNNKVNRLTVDCVDNDVGYVKGNLVLCCNRCNNVKNDFFTYEEIKFIGEIFIKPKWERQLEHKL